ncbi:related to AUT1 - essential for autophagocytosis [Melanopsichium pennsylvanicum]|uniref:Autophagy-related protein 3 n=2 Tax=Melanopsichium pennsylvanicum TaxID=63383 RepID=A0AAJ5C2H2_9BASI|nr:related to AUT1-essential for autophagocytosis [Melanopsichium pennsylvanicum 4]SNX81497.1 related to AUT1 - essential for autophagocytosis [Melanopsichium pennsylvanicum]
MNTLQTHFWAVREYLSPVLRESKFKEHGRITPDEFVAAGDFLSYKFPTWQWCAGSPSKARDYLPKDKQFLISCGVPSLRRVSQIEKGVGVGVKEDDEKLMSFDEAGAEAGEDEQWVATHYDQHSGSSNRANEMADIPDMGEDFRAPEQQLTEGQEDDLAARVAGIGLENDSSLPQSTSGNCIGDLVDIQDIPDMNDDDEEALGLGVGVEEVDDPATATKPSLQTTLASSNSTGVNSNILSVRKYDCIITYDKYYQTPRMWLVGYDEHGVPLKPYQIFEDVSSDYAQKTVTIEPFPHGHAGPDSSATSNSNQVGVATASIHPCKHASVMKKVIERMNSSVIEEQKKVVAAESGLGGAGGGNGVEKKKRRGWGIGNAVKRVTGAGSGVEVAGQTSIEVKEGETAQVEAESNEQVEGLRVDQYMIIFLKFMASIVPAIEIDATQAV